MTQKFMTGVSEDMKTVNRLEVIRKITFSTHKIKVWGFCSRFWCVERVCAVTYILSAVKHSISQAGQEVSW